MPRSEDLLQGDLPNLWAPLLVYFTLLMPAYVSAEAALTYLGVGIKNPTPTLGNILAARRVAYSESYFFFFFVPSAMIAAIVISFQPARRRQARRARSEGRPLVQKPAHTISESDGSAVSTARHPSEGEKQMGTTRKRLVAAAASLVVAAARRGCPEVTR